MSHKHYHAICKVAMNHRCYHVETSRWQIFKVGCLCTKILCVLSHSEVSVLSVTWNSSIMHQVKASDVTKRSPRWGTKLTCCYYCYFWKKPLVLHLYVFSKSLNASPKYSLFLDSCWSLIVTWVLIVYVFCCLFVCLFINFFFGPRNHGRRRFIPSSTG